MATKKYYLSTDAKPGYPYDRKRKQYYSWGFDIWVNGKRLQERGFATEQAAEDAVAEIRRQQKNARHGIEEPAESPFLIDLFQKKLRSMSSRQEKVRAKRVFEDLLQMLPDEIRVSEVRTAHIQNYIQYRLSEVSPATVKRELVPIVSALRNAYQFFPELDDYRPPRIPRPRVPKSRRERIITPAEQKKLLKYFFAPKGAKEDPREPAMRRRVGQFFLFCMLTVSRPGEIAGLKKSDIDLDGGVVNIRGTKSRFTASQLVRRLRITPTLAAIVRERLKEAQGEYLFTKGGRVTPRMYEKIRHACESAGIKYGKKDMDGVVFHTARHTGITMLVQSGMDLKTVGKLAGHSDAQMTMYYTHVRQELLDQAGHLLEGKLGMNGEKLESLEGEAKSKRRQRPINAKRK